MTDQFRIGRTVLLNGPRQGPGGPQVNRLTDDTIQLRGTFTPRFVEDDNDPELALAISAAFQQQWVGMNELVNDAVPIVSPAPYRLTGWWLPGSMSLSEIPRRTAEDGVIEYSGSFTRFRPGWATIGHEFIGTTANRSIGVHNVTADGVLWWPTPTIWQNSPNKLPISTTPIVSRGAGWPDKTGVVQGVAVSDVENGLDVVTGYGYGVNPIHHYVGACTIEREDARGWYPVEGRQLPTTGNTQTVAVKGRTPPGTLTPENVRVSNGLVRATFFDQQGAIDGYVLLEAFSQTDRRWGFVGQFSLDGNWPTTIPSIVFNTPELVTLRYPVVTTANQRGFVTITVKRGARWVEVGITADLVPVSYGISELTATPPGVSFVGGMVQGGAGGGPDGHSWIMLSPFENTGDSNPAANLLAVQGTSAQFALAAHIDGSTNPYMTVDDVRDDYWKIIAVDQHPIAL